MSEFSMFRSDCAVLGLVLKRKWYEMIEHGEKREEYRAATDYWLKRLANWDLHPAGTPVVEFRLGYSKNAPRMAFWVFGQNTVSGMKTYALVDDDTDKPRHPEWGEPDERISSLSLADGFTSAPLRLCVRFSHTNPTTNKEQLND